MTTHYLPLEPRTYPSPCPACTGTGVTGVKYEMTTSPENTLLVDVICPACGGCGNGDPDHSDCPRDAHAELDESDWDDDLVADDFGPAAACASCITGRGWNDVQAFNDTEVWTLRVPCGCSTARLVEVAAS